MIDKYEDLPDVVRSEAEAVAEKACAKKAAELCVAVPMLAHRIERIDKGGVIVVSEAGMAGKQYHLPQLLPLTVLHAGGK